MINQIAQYLQVQEITINLIIATTIFTGIVSLVFYLLFKLNILKILNG